MNKVFMQAVLLVASLLGFSQALAGYWSSAGGDVWRNSAGECWHTGYWVQDMAIVGCDGKVAEAPPPPVPEPEPAPPPAPVAVTTTDATVNFGFDRADLDPDAVAAIDGLVQQARADARIRSVRLTGHADRIGAEEYNLDLSLRRAGAVSDYLTQNAGIDPQAIELTGKGESQPLVGCEGTYGAAAIRCLAPNRRVEVVLDLF